MICIGCMGPPICIGAELACEVTICGCGSILVAWLTETVPPGILFLLTFPTVDAMTGDFGGIPFTT